MKIKPHTFVRPRSLENPVYC